MTYSQEVVDALRDSIKKWELIAKGRGGDKGIENNLLCHIFFKTSCVGCPIFWKTSLEACKNTPYSDWLEHHDEIHHFSYPRRLRCEKCRELIQKELDFLRNLLKEIE
jgi:hypothetical protein